MKKNKKVLIAVIAIVLVIAVLLTVYFVATAKKAGDKDVTLEIVIDGSSENYQARTDGSYVIDILNKLQDKKKISFVSEEGIYGEYLTTVNDREAKDREYYALYINGEYASFGISAQTIEDGDAIKIVLETW